MAQNKQDWLASKNIQYYIETSETFQKGKEFDNMQWSSKSLANLIRQSVKLGFLDINFKNFEIKTGSQSIVRTYRNYLTSPKGRLYVQSPHTVKVMSPFIDLLCEKNNPKEFNGRTRNSRNRHYLPTIKTFLKSSNKWLTLTDKNEYEFPGFGKTDVLYYCKDLQSKSFAAKTRLHYLHDDNQLSKSPTQTQQHEITIDGTKTKVHITRSSCEGVKVCSRCPTSDYVVSNRQRINRCPVHKKKTVPLQKTGICPVQFLYICPAVDDGRRWVGTLKTHTHKKPAHHKISSMVQEDIQTTALNNLRCTAKYIYKGLGMNYVPCEKSLAASNIDRVRRERRLVLGSILRNENKENNGTAIATIIDFEKIRNKVEKNQDDDNSGLT